MQKVMEELYQGAIDTREAKASFHHYYNQMGLNPLLAGSLSELMLTEEGRAELENYEKFLNQSNWIIARVAAGVQSVESAMTELKRAMSGVETGCMKNCSAAIEGSIRRLFFKTASQNIPFVEEKKTG